MSALDGIAWTLFRSASARVARASLESRAARSKDRVVPCLGTPKAAPFGSFLDYMFA
jgi:hypothetical protein